MAATDMLSPLSQLTPKTSSSDKNASPSAQPDMNFSEALKNARERLASQTASSSQSQQSPQTPEKMNIHENQGVQAASKEKGLTDKPKVREGKDTSASKDEDEKTSLPGNQAEATLLSLQELLRTATTVQAQAKPEGQEVPDTLPDQVDTALVASSQTMAAPESANLAGMPVAETSEPGGVTPFTKTAAAVSTTATNTDTNISAPFSSPAQTNLKAESASSGQGKNDFQESGSNKNLSLPETILSANEKSGEKAPESSSSNQPSNFATELLNAHAAFGTKAESNSLNKVSPPQIQVYTPVSHSNWADEMGQKISWIAHRDDSKVELILTPANMGKVEVSINLNGDQASAAFSAANPQAREALEDALPRLREVLAQAGIQLGEANVNAGTQRQAEQNLASQGHARMGMRIQEEMGLPTVQSPQKNILANGLVDLFA